MRKIFLLSAATVFFIAAFAQDIKIENNQLVLDEPILFAAGKAEIKEESIATLTRVKEFLTKKDYISTLRIEGHVNALGSANNQTLSEQRALAVAKWLTNNGVDCKRLLPVGFGNTKPIESDNTPEGRSKNNRIAFVIAALRGRAIGGMPVDGGGKIAGDVCQ